MNWKKLINDALSPIAPTSFQHYNGEEKTYITFFCYNDMHEEYAEGEEIVTVYYVQVDLWSDTADYDGLVEQIKSAMKTAGFKGYAGQDFYEKDTEIYHKSMRFNIEEEK